MCLVEHFLACDQCRDSGGSCKPSSDDGPCKECLARGTQCSWNHSAGKTGSDVAESSKAERIRQWQADLQMATPSRELAQAIREGLLGADLRALTSPQPDWQGQVGMNLNDERAYAARIAREVKITIKMPTRGRNTVDEARKSLTEGE